MKSPKNSMHRTIWEMVKSLAEYRHVPIKDWRVEFWEGRADREFQVLRDEVLFILDNAEDFRKAMKS